MRQRVDVDPRTCKLLRTVRCLNGCLFLDPLGYRVTRSLLQDSEILLKLRARIGGQLVLVEGAPKRGCSTPRYSRCGWKILIE